MIARILFLSVALLAWSSAFAADNATLITPCASGCVTTRAKDVGGGVQSFIQIPGDTSGNPLATAPGTPNASFALPIQGVTGGTSLPVSATALPLPTGAATSALQTTGNTALTTINTTLGSPMQATGGSVTANAGTNLNTSALATSANQTTEISSLATIATNTGASIPAGTQIIGNVGVIIPAGATAITASATGTTAATTATLPGAVGKTTYMCWSSVRANATAATTVTDTITGVVTGTLSRSLWIAPAASGLGVDEMIYNPCVPASATNTGIAIVSGAPGTGGVVTVNGGGYQL